MILQKIHRLERSTADGAQAELKEAQAAYQSAILRMVDALKEMEGEEISTVQLMDEVFGAANGRDCFDELFQIDQDVKEAAQAAGLILDMSKHENRLEGLPFNLDYLVRRS